MTKVITYGTYDLLHVGHIRLLQRAKALGDYLVVGVTSDEYDRQRGKQQSVMSQDERMEAVRATGLADEIILETHAKQKAEDIQRLGIDIFTVGSDWEGVFDYLGEFCKIVYLPRTPHVSSTAVRGRKRALLAGLVGSPERRKETLQAYGMAHGVRITEEAGMEELECPQEFITRMEKVDLVFLLEQFPGSRELIEEALLHRIGIVYEYRDGFRYDAELAKTAERQHTMYYVMD